MIRYTTLNNGNKPWTKTNIARNVREKCENTLGEKYL
jgi:hypothetical protein